VAGKAVFHSGMKRILFAVLLAVFTATVAVRAQDSGTQQQIDKIFGMIQDVQAAQELQTKKMAALEKDIADLRDKVNTPAANPDNASAADLKNLAEKVQEIDKKRAADRDLILNQIKDLGKSVARQEQGHAAAAGGRHGDCRRAADGA
jgi:septal ring factor EnvC (AmiA/AmiB activator)